MLTIPEEHVFSDMLTIPEKHVVYDRLTIPEEQPTLIMLHKDYRKLDVL
jgi:hypothetical protein